MLAKGSQVQLNALSSGFEYGKYIFSSNRRGYVWGPNEVALFMNSIIKGNHLGTIEVWRPADADLPRLMLMKPRHLGALGMAKGTIRPQMMIMDGYNRLATLAWALTLKPAKIEYSPQELAVWRSGMTLVFDETGEFRWCEEERVEDELCLPACMMNPGAGTKLPNRAMTYMRMRQKDEWESIDPARIDTFRKACHEAAHRLYEAKASMNTYFNGEEVEVLIAMHLNETAGVKDNYLDAVNLAASHRA